MIILTVLSIATLVAIADGIQRSVESATERQRREDLIRKGYIL